MLRCRGRIPQKPGPGVRRKRGGMGGMEEWKEDRSGCRQVQKGGRHRAGRVAAAWRWDPWRKGVSSGLASGRLRVMRVEARRWEVEETCSEESHGSPVHLRHPLSGLQKAAWKGASSCLSLCLARDSSSLESLQVAPAHKDPGPLPRQGKHRSRSGGGGGPWNGALPPRSTPHIAPGAAGPAGPRAARA